jgi:1-acyl-sn-glycerol-3-phosphate acyltransferase
MRLAIHRIKSHKIKSYKFNQIFWSIYFLIGIVLIGVSLGYLTTMSIYTLSLLTFPFKKLSLWLRNFAETFQCLCIRLLLKLQPWLECENNFQPIIHFYDQYKTQKIIFVANHRSNLDTFLMISFIPGLRGLAKKSLFYNIFFLPFMLIMGFIPVEKGSTRSFIQGLKSIRFKLLEKNHPVLIFPENTRCPKGYPALQKFSESVFKMAIDAKALVVPVAIKNSDQLLGKGDLFLTPYAPVKLTIFQAIKADEFIEAKTLSQMVWNTISTGLL